MSFVKIGEVVKDVAQLSGDPDAMEAAYVVERVQKEVGNLLGDKAIGAVSVLKYANGEIVFGVVSGAWAQEIALNSLKIKKYISKLLPEIVVKKISSRNV